MRRRRSRVRARPLLGRVAGRRQGTDAGMVTAELAAVLPAVAFVLVVVLNAVAIGIDQVRVVDAARMSARSASRGDDPAEVRAVAIRAAPAGAQISVQRSADLVQVRVSAPPPGPLGWLTGRRPLSASVIAPVEQ